MPHCVIIVNYKRYKLNYDTALLFVNTYYIKIRSKEGKIMHKN